MCSQVHAGDRDAASLNLGLKQQSLHGFDTSMSIREYQQVSGRNRKMVLKNLESYSGNALESIGVPRQGAGLAGATLGLVYHKGTRLNLNKSKTLALEVKDVTGSDRGLYFGVNLGW